MKGHAEKEDILLVCIGYKYNLKKVLVFLTKGMDKHNLESLNLQSSQINKVMFVQEKFHDQISYQTISTN